MADEAREAPEENEEPEQNYSVPFRMTGSVVVRAHNAEEAQEVANEHFGPAELAVLDGKAVDDLEYGYRYGPDTEPTDEQRTVRQPILVMPLTDTDLRTLADLLTREERDLEVSKEPAYAESVTLLRAIVDNVREP